jgi:hypothetical protein
MVSDSYSTVSNTSVAFPAIIKTAGARFFQPMDIADYIAPSKPHTNHYYFVDFSLSKSLPFRQMLTPLK